MSESARGEGGRVWVPRKPQDPRDPQQIPEAERYYFLEERYPKYGNLVPRDIATREIFNVCINEGLSVETDRLCVYLDLTHICRRRARPQARRHPGNLREVPGRRPARRADEDLPGRPLLDGRAVGATTNARPTGGLQLGFAAQPADQHPGPVRHRRVRLPVPRRQPPGRQLAGGLHLQRAVRGPGHRRLCSSRARARSAAEQPAALFDAARRQHAAGATRTCCSGPAAARTRTCSTSELGDVMTKAATVVRHNDQLREALRRRSANWKSGPGAARSPTPATGPTRTWSSPRPCWTCSRWPRRSSRGPAPRRMPRGPLQARVRMPGI